MPSVFVLGGAFSLQFYLQTRGFNFRRPTAGFWDFLRTFVRIYRDSWPKFEKHCQPRKNPVCLDRFGRSSEFLEMDHRAQHRTFECTAYLEKRSCKSSDKSSWVSVFYQSRSTASCMVGRQEIAEEILAPFRSRLVENCLYSIPRVQEYEFPNFWIHHLGFHLRNSSIHKFLPSVFDFWFLISAGVPISLRLDFFISAFVSLIFACLLSPINRWHSVSDFLFNVLNSISYGPLRASKNS